MKKLSNQKAYEELTKKNVFWDRTSAETISVKTPGYLCANCHKIEAFLMKAGMHAIDQKFDSMSGLTVTIYKHKAA